MSSAKASDAVGPEQRRAVGRFISQAAGVARPVVQEIQQQIPEGRAGILRRIEENKLMGVPVSQ